MEFPLTTNCKSIDAEFVCDRLQNNVWLDDINNNFGDRFKLGCNNNNNNTWQLRDAKSHSRTKKKKVHWTPGKTLWLNYYVYKKIFNIISLIFEKWKKFEGLKTNRIIFSKTCKTDYICQGKKHVLTWFYRAQYRLQNRIWTTLLRSVVFAHFQTVFWTNCSKNWQIFEEKQ